MGLYLFYEDRLSTAELIFLVIAVFNNGLCSFIDYLLGWGPECRDFAYYVNSALIIFEQKLDEQFKKSWTEYDEMSDRENGVKLRKMLNAVQTIMIWILPLAIGAVVLPYLSSVYMLVEESFRPLQAT